MLSGDDDALDMRYLTTYKNATFANGSFNPETRTSYVDEVEIAFAKGGNTVNTGSAPEKAVVKTRKKPMMSKTMTALPGLSSSGKSSTKKKKKKTKGKKSRRDVTAKEEFMADISNGAEVAGRRVWTANNDTDYQQLDGSFPFLIGVVEPFDAKFLTHAERMMVGAARGIPSQHKHAKTFIQGYVDPQTMRETGPGFKKVPDLHGVVAQETKQSIQAKYPEWLELRENYFRQLEMKADKVHELVEGSEVIPDTLKQQFLLLLVAVRKVTIRIAFEYEAQSLAVNRDDSNHSARDAANHLCKYMFSVPHCMEPFNHSPFTEWTGVNLHLNPLVTKTTLSGDSAIISPRREGIAGIQRLANGSMEYGNYASPVLDVEERESRQCGHVNSMLWYIVQERFALGDNLSSYARTELIKPDKDYLEGLVDMRDMEQRASDEDGSKGEEPEDSDSEVDISNMHKSNLNVEGLMARTAESVNRALKDSRQKKLLVLGKTRKAALFRAWKRVYNNELAVADALILRDTRNMRQCYESLRTNHWRCVKFRGIQENSHRRVVLDMLTAWKQYSRFAKRFNSIFMRSVVHVKRKILLAMREFAETCFDNRRFRYKNEMRHLAHCFNALKHNTKLCQHELNKRLEYRHAQNLAGHSVAMQNALVINFMDRSMITHCFSRWKARNVALRLLDDLEESIEQCWMKDAMVKWYIHVHGPKKERMARKIAKYKGFVHGFRMSVEGGMRSSYDSLKVGAVKAGTAIRRSIEGPPPPTPEEVAAAHEATEASRKKRMANALKYSKKRKEMHMLGASSASDASGGGSRKVRQSFMQHSR